MDWNDLRFFLAVANLKSLSSASRFLRVSTSTVSRRIDALEGALGVKLFRAHAEGYELTEAGTNLLAPAQEAEAQMREFERAAKDKEHSLSGSVRVDVPELLGQEILLPNLVGFAADYPAIQLDMRTSVRTVRLANERPDIVIRLVPPDRGGYRMRSVGKVMFGFHAHRKYLDAHGTPSNESELRSHRVIGWSEDLGNLVMSTWLEEVLIDCHPVMRLSSFAAQLAAVESGLGVAVLPCFATRKHDLVPVLDELPRLTLDLWLLVQEQAAQLPRVRIVKERLMSILRENKALLEGL